MGGPRGRFEEQEEAGRPGRVDKGPRRRQSEEGQAADSGIEVSTCYLLR